MGLCSASAPVLTLHTNDTAWKYLHIRAARGEEGEEREAGIRGKINLLVSETGCLLAKVIRCGVQSTSIQF